MSPNLWREGEIIHVSGRKYEYANGTPGGRHTMTNQCLYFHIFVCFIHPPVDTHENSRYGKQPQVAAANAQLSRQSERSVALVRFPLTSKSSSHKK